MKFFELDDPHVDVVMFLNENKHEPKMALVDASLHFGLPTEEILTIYRRHLKETTDETIPKTKKSFDFLSLTKKAKAKLKTHNAYKTIDAKELIGTNRLKGTQDKPSDPSVGEEAFSTLSHPVIVEVNGVGYILDGHGRIAKSIKKETPIKVHWVKIS